MKFLLVCLLCCTLLVGCPDVTKDADQLQAEKTQQIQSQLDSKLGLPNVSNGQEKRLLKELYELRDKSDLATYTYTFSEVTGELKFLGKSIGYGIPGAIQYSNPQRVEIVRVQGVGYEVVTLPQPEPNGLFMPDSVSATWVYLIASDGSVSPTYVEPTITVSLFPLPAAIYPEGGPQYSDLVPPAPTQ